MQRVFETCVPREEVLSGKLTDDMFAAKLEKVIDGQAPPIYQDPNVFLNRTFPTEGLKTLISQVMSRVTDSESSAAPIIRLETSFGGGKTHGLIALYHLARNNRSLGELPEDLVDPALVPDEEIPFAAVVGPELDPVNGIKHGDVTTYTIWGEIAYQLGGAEGYALMEKSDTQGTRPGSGIWEELLGDRPAIICIDEIANFIRAFGRKHASAEQTASFLQTLFGVASSLPRVCVVWTLAGAGDAFADESERLIAQLNELGSIGARQEIVLTPTGDTEYAPVINHRLFDAIDSDAAQKISDEFVRFYDQAASRGVALPDEATSAVYRDKLERDYPFHPATIETLSLKTAAISNFHRTRGMLRLLAQVVRNIWEIKPEDAYTIQPYHIDVGIEPIRRELTSRLDHVDFVTVIEADIHAGDGQSHAQKLDQAWIERDKPRLASRVACSILLNSITIGQARGATEADINLACGVPCLDFAYVEEALNGLYDSCWYIDPDRTRYRFQTEPQINRIIHQEYQNVERVAAKSELHDRIRNIFGGSIFEDAFFVEEPNDVDDNAGKPKLAVLDFDSETVTGASDGLPRLVSTIYTRAGTQEKFRTYQNNVLFLVADQTQRENMIEVARRYVALERLTAPTRLAEYEEKHREVLRSRMGDAELDLRVAVTRAYRHLFYPDREEQGLKHHMMDVQESAQADKRDQHKVLVELLAQLNKVLRGDDDPLGPAYAKDRVWHSGEQELSTAEYTRRFAVNRQLPIVLVADQHKRTIKGGVEQGTWVYYDGNAERAYYKTAPPSVSIDEDHMLYTVERAEELGLLARCPRCGNLASECTCPAVCPHCGKPKGQCTCGDVTRTCPLCGKPAGECTCALPPPPPPKAIRVEGTPKKAFTDLRDKCEAAGIEALSKLSITVDDVQEIRVMGVALPQLVELQLEVSVSAARFLAEHDGGDLAMEFTGAWEKLKTVRDFIEQFSKQAKDRSLNITLDLMFPAPVAPDGLELQRMLEAFDSLQLGKIEMTGFPAEEEGEDG